MSFASFVDTYTVDVKNRIKESTWLRAENKDYSLLRKFFGHRQIANLLEQAKANKGKQRDERSR